MTPAYSVRYLGFLIVLKVHFHHVYHICCQSIKKLGSAHNMFFSTICLYRYVLPSLDLNLIHSVVWNSYASTKANNLKRIQRQLSGIYYKSLFPTPFVVMMMHGSFSSFIPGTTEGILLMNYSRLMFTGVSDTGHPFWTVRILDNNFGDFSMLLLFSEIKLSRSAAVNRTSVHPYHLITLSPYTPTTSMNAANHLRQVELIRIRDARCSWGHGFSVQVLNGYTLRQTRK
jgi:hypothetical protein